jgi:hypothetical protein
MSQIVRAIKAHSTNTKAILNDSFSPLFLKTVGIESVLDSCRYADAKVYSVSVNIGYDVLVQESDASEGHNHLHHAIERCKKQVIEAIFGEFRSDIRMLEHALYNRDFEGAQACLQNLEKKMFTEE